jgi:hypothetical protein
MSIFIEEVYLARSYTVSTIFPLAVICFVPFMSLFIPAAMADYKRCGIPNHQVVRTYHIH